MAWVRASVVAFLLASAGCSGISPDARQSGSGDAGGPPGVSDDTVKTTAFVAASERSLRGAPVAIRTTQPRWDTVGGVEPTEPRWAREGADG